MPSNIIEIGGSAKPSKTMPKGLAQRLSQPKTRKPVRKPSPRVAADARQEENDQPNTRGAVKFNPVTGQMQRIQPNKNAGMVREGCMMIPEKYLHAAVEAGLGSSKGMYDHMAGVNRTLRSSNNTGHSSLNKSNPRPSGNKGYQPKVTQATVGGRAGGTVIHKIDTSSSSAPPRKSNIKQCVQGRSRSVRSNSGGTAHESHYSKQKGVVSTFGGCVSSKTRQYQENKNAKKGIAQLNTGSGGRTFIKVDKNKKIEKSIKPSSTCSTAIVSRRESVTKKLGGGSSASTSSSAANDRERRAAYFASRFGGK